MKVVDIMDIGAGNDYLVRVIVKDTLDPARVVTVYNTSKAMEYYTPQSGWKTREQSNMQWQTDYRTIAVRKGSSLGYGLKFWPEEFQKLKSANPHIALFADEGKL